MNVLNKLFGKKHKKRSSISIETGEGFEQLLCNGYTKLTDNPEILAAARQVAELISSMTVHLMTNTDKGDKRIVNELSRMIDITPSKRMTRRTWMDAVIMNLLIYGNGNSIVLPHTENGLLSDLEVIAPCRVSFANIGYSDYKVLIDGKQFDPDDVLHFVLNPDQTYPWKGTGYRVALKDIAGNLQQAQVTKKKFLSSKYIPPLIVKVDGLIDEFADPEGRKRLIDEYISTTGDGEPWMIPADALDIQEVRPLTLADLAINEAVQIDKRTAAAILGVPAFVVGVGNFDPEEWDNFIRSKIRPIVEIISQEETRKLIINPKWYIRFNIESLYSWDLQITANVYGYLKSIGVVTGNELRDKLSMPPLDGLDELTVLENYIPLSMVDKQKKLKGENE